MIGLSAAEISRTAEQGLGLNVSLLSWECSYMLWKYVRRLKIGARSRASDRWGQNFVPDFVLSNAAREISRNQSLIRIIHILVPLS